MPLSSTIGPCLARKLGHCWATQARASKTDALAKTTGDIQHWISVRAAKAPSMNLDWAGGSRKRCKAFKSPETAASDALGIKSLKRKKRAL